MRTGFWLTTSLVLAVAFMSGCGQTGSAPAQTEKQADTHDDHDHNEHTASTESGGHDHSGWWCNEHGVPEEVCALCNSKVAAEFQKKGDWCKEHDRPDSQCFKCHPELEAKFAAQYEAKYGQQPPKPAG
uniref:RND transporter n=1 Tax=Schlesneria paludicola TaxID=360056 RepID=A0A7C2P5C9_9PLAN